MTISASKHGGQLVNELFIYIGRYHSKSGIFERMVKADGGSDQIDNSLLSWPISDIDTIFQNIIADLIAVVT